MENQLVINDDFLFSIGKNTFFTDKEDGLYVEYIPKDNKKIEFRLKELRELYEGDGIFAFQSDDDIDHYNPLLESIESAIEVFYENNPDYKDKNIRFVLEMLNRNPEAKMNSELAKQIQNNLRLCLAFNVYSRKEVAGGIKRIIKSLKDHHFHDGAKGYVDFVKHRF